MKWKKFTLKTTTEAVDYISSLFDEIGIQGIEIEDNVPLTESETKPESAASSASAQPEPMAESDVQDAILATAGDSAAADSAAASAVQPEAQAETGADSAVAEAPAAEDAASTAA